MPPDDDHEPQVPVHDASAYARRGHRRVPGWLSPVAAAVVVELGRHQLDNGVLGAVAEIGVHRGKLFILLDLLRRPTERALAIDVFDDTLMDDRSGLGDRRRFERNVERFVGDVAHLDVIERSSAAVAPEDVIDRVGRVRLMSVDGGHTAALTANDLRLAEHVLVDDGLVVLDDVFNARWPGVVSGLVEHLAEGRLVPVGIAPNKVFLSFPAAAARYRDVLLASSAGLRTEEARLLGADVAVIAGYDRGLTGLLQRAYRLVRDVPALGAAAERAREARRRR